MSSTLVNEIESTEEPLEARSLSLRHLWIMIGAAWACVLFFAFINRLYPYLNLPPQTFFAFYVPLEVLRIAVCGGIFFVRWVTREFTTDVQSLVIGAGFLALAILLLFRLMANLGMAGVAGLEISNASLYLRTIARWTLILSMLIASFLPVEGRVSVRARNTIIAASGILALLTGSLLLLLGTRLPSLSPLSAGAAESIDVLGYSAMGISSFLAYRYGRLAIKKSNSSLYLIALGMATAIPTEYAFILVNSENDLFKLIGNLLGAIGFVLIFIAIVKTSLIKPYKQLSLTKKQLESSVIRLKGRTTELTVANKELETFTYSVAHDLRNPLQSILSWSEIISNDLGDKLEEVDRLAFGHILQATEEMSRVIAGLLALSHIAKLELHRKDINLSHIARKIVEGLKTSDAQRSVDCIIDPGLTVSADPELVHVLLENLLGNAWKFTAKRPKARIEFGAIRNADSTIYFIRDNGAGFNMAHSENLFKPFYRLHPKKEFNGSGIGLAIVKRIVDKHGGAVWAESGKDNGATFYFRLN